MPMTLQLDAVNFSVNAIHDDSGAIAQIVIVFADPSGIGQVIVPFAPDGWENFKRHVAADGAVPKIEIARGNGAAPRLDIPKG